PDENSVIKNEYIEPTTEIEKKIAEVWKEVLSYENISITDNFFELGGHSLSGMRIVSILNKELNKKISIKEFFDNITIKELAKYIENKEEKSYKKISKAEKKKYYDLSSPQKRMYMLWENNKVNVAYNMPSAFITHESIDIEKLEKVFNKLVIRHSALRTRFVNIEGHIKQEILNELNIKTQYIDDSSNDAVIDEKVRKLITPFDLNNGPLVRLIVSKVSEFQYILFMDIHHIISDGLTTGILVKELSEMFLGNELKEVEYDYVDYSEYQNKLEELGDLKKQKEFWLKELSGELPVIDLPLDYKRITDRSFRGEKLELVIESDLADKIREFNRKNNNTSYAFFTSCISILIHKFSNQEDILIGSPFSGRTHLDTQDIVGMFVNTIVFRTQLQNHITIKEYMDCTKNKVLSIYDNQDYQFDTLLNKLQYKRENGRNPLFDIMFAMQNADISDIYLGSNKIKPYKFDMGIEKFDITFQAFEGEEIEFEISYSIDIFKKETILNMISGFKKIIELVLANENITIGELDIVDNLQKQKLLNTFNDANKSYDNTKTLEKYFEEQVEKNPEKTAV
ncbi:MAG: condensation domain-containing protein, partial [Clostridium sp.]